VTLLSDLRARLATVMAGVAGIGQVHDYFRRAQHEAEIQALFQSSGRLHVWFVTLGDDTPYTERRKGGVCSEATVRYALHGYFALEDADASEKEFEVVLQAVLTALRSDPYLGLSDVVIEAAPPAVSVLGHAKFADVLCHYARVDMSIRAHLEG
jgi:hypothetical protein